MTIFNEDDGVVYDRYPTRSAAENGHAEAVRQIEQPD